MMMNTELGVLLPPRKGSKEAKLLVVEALPFRFPAKKYTSTQRPFMNF